MKTIDINLIGNFKKTAKKAFLKGEKGFSFGGENKFLAYILIIGIMITFATSLGGWFLVKHMAKSLDKKLFKLNQSLNSLKEQETNLTLYRKSLKTEKEITELKIKIQKQLDSSFFPWSSVLLEIAAKMPKDIIILKIEKEGNAKKTGKSNEALKLKISGIIPANKQKEPLMTISLFIFSLNENKNSLLTSAKISKLEFNDKTKTYEFEIQTSIKTTQDKNL